ncbi:MAG: sugar ABC transporter permease [Solirubrobacteraceae bacterium]|jgi:multiple sugar transport system permease protein
MTGPASTTAVPPVRYPPVEGVRARRARREPGSSRTAGYFFVGLYVVLLLALGIAPAVYAIALALSTPGGIGVAHFVNTFNFFEFAPAFEHIVEFEAIWLVSQTVFVVMLALMVHPLVRHVSTVFRFIFYLPGAMAGAASAIVWLFMFTPSGSPWAFILHAFNYQVLSNTVALGNLPMIFAIMAFFTGAGGWIVIMYGALNNIPQELIEAADIDGANAFQTAFRIKLPLIRKWVVYMLVLSFAAGSQLFVEPQILGVATNGEISPQWSPNQLAYSLAFQFDRFNDAAAVSVDLLVIGLIVAVLLVWRGRLFEVD